MELAAERGETPHEKVEEEPTPEEHQPEEVKEDSKTDLVVEPGSEESTPEQ